MQNSETAQKIRTRITLDRELYDSARHIAVGEGPHVDVRQLIARALREFVQRRQERTGSTG